MFDDALLDDTAALATIDGALREVAGWGAQVRLAGLAAEPGLAELSLLGQRPRAVVGAGADGRLFRAVLEPVCPVPYVAWPHAWLPGWTGPLDLVVVLSVAGSDADSLAVAAESVRRGAALLVSAPRHSPLAEVVAGRGVVLEAGSTDPLALAVPILAALHAVGLGPAVPVEPVAAALDEVAIRCGPAVGLEENPAKQLAMSLGDALPVLWGGSVLAARAARRMAEQLRAASGRPAVAGDEAQVLPLLASAPEPDVFADPFADSTADPLEDPFADERSRLTPALVILDDGEDDIVIRTTRATLVAAAQARRVRVHTMSLSEQVASGPLVARFASLQAMGRYSAAYLGLGLANPVGPWQ